MRSRQEIPGRSGKEGNGPENNGAEGFRQADSREEAGQPGNAGWPYEDIVNLPHHVSQTHLPMTPLNRAAQFAPFAALTGYEDAVEETARLTDEEAELDESAVEELNRKLTGAAADGRELRITYFQPDDRKAGGKYAEISGVIRRFEGGDLVLADGRRIPLEHIADADRTERERNCPAVRGEQ